MTLSSLNDATKIDMATWSVGMRPKLIRSTACNVRRPAVHESLALACKLDPSQRGNGPPTRLEIKWPSAAIALWFREIALWFNAGLSVVKPDVLSSPQGLQWVKKQTCASAHEHLRLASGGPSAQFPQISMSRLMKRRSTHTYSGRRV